MKIIMNTNHVNKLIGISCFY